MRRPIAYGLALLLSLASLGAAHGPDKSEASITEVKYDLKPTASLGRKPGMSNWARRNRPYEVGTASWYGEYFQGRTTASGEPYDMYDLTAAHPSLPLGTRIRVTNLRNGKAVILRVNDRGPVVDGRIIDVSYGAAQLLGMSGRGIQRVRLDLAPEPRSAAAQAAIRHASISQALEKQIQTRSLQVSALQSGRHETPQTEAMLQQRQQ
jgi:rare lipoprotein A